MSITGLITEYNPFHNGHQYHLNKSKEITQNDDLIVIMSGNFTQRAETALLDKWARTKQALNCGADLVIELPLIYDIRSAEYFAHYSILTLEKSSIVDSIVFGSENGNIDIIKVIAEAFNNENQYFKTELEKFLKKGYNFPTARRKALLASFDSYQGLQSFSKKDIKKVLKEPNNILGIEYLKSLKKINSKIKAHTIKRIGTDYHSDEVKNNYASASLIRKIINNNPKKEGIKKVKSLMPEKSWQILKDEVEKGRFVKRSSNNSIILKTIDQVRRLTPSNLKEYKGIKNGIENRFYQAALENTVPAKFLETLTCKNLTESKIKRKILQIYFELTAAKIEAVENNAPHYIRVLGVKKGKEYLLSDLKKKSELPLIINPAAKINELDFNKNKALNLSLSYDILATDLYSLLYENPEYRKARRDYHQELIKL